MSRVNMEHSIELLERAAEECRRVQELFDIYMGKVMDELDHESAEIRRLASGAAIDAQSASAEINEQLFRFFYGVDGHE